ncbi:MAG: hypothetical protein D6767_10225 [Candidatus Hydrogenedentota bacterium]|nr:MAG: hypothetical protein D6767_10225 [Candidatus Hydrogenedentota bacterium]
MYRGFLLLLSFIVIQCYSNPYDLPTEEAPLPVEPKDTIPPEISQVYFYTTTSTIRITWQTNELATTRVYYGISSPLNQVQDTGTSLTQTHDITISGLNAGTRYTFKLESVDASQNKAVSFDFSIQTLSAGSDSTPPSAVTNVSVPLISPNPPYTTTATSTNLTISWDANTDSDFAAYQIYRSTHPGVSLSDDFVGTVSSQSTTTWTDTLTGVGYWYYVVVVQDTSGNISSLSNEVAVARYPIGNIFRLEKNSTLTNDYLNNLPPASSPAPGYYQAPTVFLFCDALNENNGGIPINTKLAENFALYEFVWSSTAHAWNHSTFNGVTDTTFNYANLDPSMVNHLQNIRNKWGGPLILNSSYRSVQRNAQLYGGTYTYSRHQYGDAVDIANPNGNDYTTWERIANMATAFRKQDSPYCNSSTGCSGEGANFIESYAATGTWIHADWRYERNFSYQNY